MELKRFDTDVAVALQDLTSTLLHFVGGVALVFIVATGVYYISTEGNEEKQKRAKAALVHILLGLVIVMFSFAILQLINRLAVQTN